MPDLQNPEIFRTVLDSLPIGVYLVGRDRKIVFWNTGAETITGYQRHEVVGHLSRESILAQCNEMSCVLCGIACPLTAVIHEGKPKEAQVFLRHKAGHLVPAHLRITPIRDLHGSVVGAAESFEEEREPIGLDIHQTNLAAHGCLDVLTGVPNHAFTQSHLRENLAFLEEYHLPFGILRIEIQQLEQLQSSHGREAVGVVLHVIAQTMKHTLRPDGFLGRWGESEFLAIMTYCDNAALLRAAQSVHKMASCSGIQWWDDLLSVAVSVGATMAQSEDTIESLIERSQPPKPAKRVAAAATIGGGNISEG
jgi:diguanylate cyclase (GGDEF)-like protein/PAS domain S-box-containing protein